jgi:hypothetical protein
LQGDRYSFSTKTISYVIVHLRVLFPFTRMANSSYSPVLHVSSYDLRIASQDTKRLLRLGSVKLSYEIQKPLSNPYALIIRQYDKSAYPIIPRSHSYMDNSDECNRSVLVDSSIASCCWSQ